MKHRYKYALLAGGAAALVALPAAFTVREKPAAEPSPAEVLMEAAEAIDDIAVSWDLPVTRNDKVDHWIEFLTGRNRDRTQLWLERSGKYGPMIRERLRDRGMPEDLLYLALIESGFSPNAYSSARAAGIWQFIAETGRRYGLEVSTHVDERRDPLGATDAALDYLQELYDRFGSWYLAAAAYNTGENRVDRILRERAGGARGDDDLFWRIAPHLPRETRDYVPLMLAAGHIAKEPAKYGFGELSYQAPLNFETVEVPGGTSLRAVARAADIEVDEVEELNPHLVHDVTPPGRTWSVRIPVGRRDVFAGNFARVAEEERLATVYHTVRRGETFSHLARRYGVSVSALQQANRSVRPNRLQVGQRVTIPGAGKSVTAYASAAPASSWTVHSVRRGDTLWAIARRYDVSIAQLRSWNGLAGSRIRPGQRLKVRA